jgi:hypothetical protein
MTFSPSAVGKQQTATDRPIRCSSLMLQREKHQRQHSYKTVMQILSSNDKSPIYPELLH